MLLLVAVVALAALQNVRAEQPAGAAEQVTGADGKPLSAETIYGRLQAALAPRRTTLMRAFFGVRLHDGQSRTYSGFVARRGFDDGVRTVIAFDGEDFIAGTALLYGTKREDGTPVEAQYRPTERRVTEIAPVLPDDPFLSSSFTRADLGFVPRGKVELRLVGARELDLRRVYVIEARPTESWYYSRIVTWIDGETWLPVKREYYDRANRLWKRAEYEAVRIEGVPVVTHIRMEDLQALIHSELVMNAIRFGGEDDDRLFERRHLGAAPEHLRKAFPDIP